MNFPDNMSRYREPGRHHPAQGVHVYSSTPTIVFVTACTRNRMPWLAAKEVQNLLVQAWTGAEAWLVGDYLLMPDHVHFFAAPRNITVPFEKWQTYWKSRFTRSHVHGEWRWQPHAFHHRLRDGESYEAKWRYVRENPVRAGLVKEPDEWPFQGRLNALWW